MKRRRILLVDDDHADRAMSVLVLGGEPAFSVDEAADGVAFADRLARGQFDLLIVADRLGWGEGLRVVEVSKSLYPDRPVVVLARDLIPELLSEGVTAGVDALLPKTNAGYLHLPRTVARLFARLPEGEAGEAARRRLTENLPVGVFAVTPAGGIARANPALAAILGCEDPADLWGEDLGRFLADPGDRELWRRALAAGQKLAGVEVRVARRGGAPSWARLNAWPVPSAGSEPRILDGTLEDISAYKQAEEELSRRAQDLDRTNAELRDFAHVVSHDLQAPLARIEGYARLLAERLKVEPDEVARGHLDHLTGATERLQTMLGAILEYARVDTRAEPPQPVAMESVLAEVLENLRGEIEGSGAEVTHDPLPELVADRTQMLLLFQNLIGNGLKFRRRQPPAIHLSAAQTERGWEIAVADNGIGIPAGDRRRIFGMFERLNPDSEFPGSGVGLAIAKRIAERHGGSIQVESTPGAGSTFTVFLPTGR